MSLTATLNYPRTGKRGVPQQFPRRLYEMLESETKVAESQPNDVFVISWSDSGKTFRITDVEEFAATVLPKYFRTNRFSSFQRNLNLVSTFHGNDDSMLLCFFLGNSQNHSSIATVWFHQGATRPRYGYVCPGLFYPKATWSTVSAPKVHCCFSQTVEDGE